MEKDSRIDGEYDPKYNFPKNPTEEAKRIAQEIVEKYEKKNKTKS